MSRLDDLNFLQSIDRDGFLGLVERFPEQVRDAWAAGKAVDARVQPEGITGVAVLGVGGSGMSGDVLKALLGPFFSRPVEVCKGYEIPGWIGRGALVFAVSYSGETEETLEAFDKARARGARMVTVSTGGTLAKIGEEAGFAGVRLQAGLQPRAALGHLLLAMLGVCQSLGFANFEADVRESVELLERRCPGYSRTSPLAQNPAKQLAEGLVGLTPVIYGSEGIAEVAAYRWKCQLNECSKVRAHSNFFSELGHNEIMGWTSEAQPDPRVALIVLRHAGEHPRIKHRISVTLPLLAGRVRRTDQIHAEGGCPLARLMDLIYAGDFVATYLAIAQGLDPTPIDLIDRIKRDVAGAEVPAGG